MQGVQDDAITAVIVTRNEQKPCIEPDHCIVLISGILLPTDNKNYVLNGDENAGVIISLHWLFSRALKDCMRRVWKRHCQRNPQIPTGKNIITVLTQTQLQNYQVEDFTLPVIREGIIILTLPSMPVLTVTTSPPNEYIINIDSVEKVLLLVKAAVVSMSNVIQCTTFK